MKNINNVESQNNSSISEIKSLEAKIKDLKRHVKNLRFNCNYFWKQNWDLEAKVKELEKDNEKLESLNIKLQETIFRLSKKLVEK